MLIFPSRWNPNSDSMKPKIHLLIHACALLAGASGHADTLAYWRFEGNGVTTPTTGVQLEDTNGRTTTTTGVGIRAVDVSGNGNTLWAWDHPWAGHTYDAAVPFSSIPQTGAPNGFFAKSAGGFPALFSWSNQSSPSGINLDTWTSTTWTIEACCYTTALGAFRTVVGREGNGVETANANTAPLYFQMQNNNRFRILYVDASGVVRVAEDPTAMVANQWYHFAATCDGVTLKLFRRTTGDSAYNLVGSTDVSSSSNPALINPGNDANGQPWGWTVARGRYGTSDNPGDNHGDRWLGGVDEIRISNVALDPTQFLAAANALDTDNDGLPNTWETAYGLDPNSNSGINGAAGDFDGDGVSNLAEFEGGSLPNNAASTPSDVDGDGLDDVWENSFFANLAQTGSGDPDGDLATNEQEENSLSSPISAQQYPDSDGDLMNDAWETAFFGNLSKDGTLDTDLDTYTDFEEHEAHTNPNDVSESPIWSALKHRWTFDGTLADSVGGSNATVIDVGANEVAFNSITTPTAITMTGGAKAASDYVQLGTNLLPNSTTPVTIELWATQNTVRNWSRIFDFNSSTAENLFMSWSVGTNNLSERVEWVDNGVVSGAWDTNQPYTLGTKFHIVMTVQPLAGAGGNTKVTWYSAPAGNSDLGAAQGTFDTTINLPNFVDLVNDLGRSPWPDDTASATYHEVRIWKGALTSYMREKLHDQGEGNPVIADTDGDFLPDAWEEVYFPGNLTALSAAGDNDLDTVSNRDEFTAGSDPDNTLSVPDDVDGDGLLDVWEIGYFTNITAQDGSGNPDNDQFTNEQEETNGTDPNNGDNDFDGLSDVWELAYFPSTLDQAGFNDPDSDTFTNEEEETAGSNPIVAASIPGDVDGDALLDAWETTYFGNITAQNGSGDPDTDTFTNEQEETGRSNPTLAASVPGDINGDGLADGHILVGSDPLGSASFNSGLNWDDGQAPAPGNNYLVSINNFRTPEGVDPHTFAGDKLVITTGGNLVIKGSGAITIPDFSLDGGLINNATAPVAIVALGGVMNVTRASEIWANNNSLIINAVITGNQTLNITRSGGVNTVTFNAVNSWTGNMNITGGFILGGTGSLKFVPGATTVSNSIGGNGSAVFNGAFAIDLGAASNTIGDNWTLVNAGSLAESYGTGFTVTGFTADAAAAGARKWTSASGTYQFDEATGVLSRIAPAGNDSDSDGLDDTWETTFFGGLSAANGGPSEDFDGDGTNNLTEFRLGLTPNSGTSRFVISQGASGLLTWPSVEGVTFVVERSTTLGSWATIATVPGTAVTASFTDPSPPSGTAFYRVGLQP